MSNKHTIKVVSEKGVIVFINGERWQKGRGECFTVDHGTSFRMVFEGKHFIVEKLMNEFEICDGFKLKEGIHCEKCDTYPCVDKFKVLLTSGIAGAAGGALVGPAAAVAGIQSLGFGAGGVVAGSTAAGMMSSAGTVASGSAIATLQSIGALGALSGGIALGAIFLPAILGALLIGGSAYGIYKLVNKDKDCYEECRRCLNEQNH
eukprot:TRINITY_DN10527_c0_g1_i1.p1 TRINITY_DN10527_c0_g1~~TRINITY_DN10527_c0_g1_i1.p1  ORF type:complete len:212 (-),score=20.96 TRINITY_DN10527_c0_g1_i1:121-735(-)